MEDHPAPGRTSDGRTRARGRRTATSAAPPRNPQQQRRSTDQRQTRAAARPAGHSDAARDHEEPEPGSKSTHLRRSRKSIEEKRGQGSSARDERTVDSGAASTTPPRGGKAGRPARRHVLERIDHEIGTLESRRHDHRIRGTADRTHHGAELFPGQGNRTQLVRRREQSDAARSLDRVLDVTDTDSRGVGRRKRICDQVINGRIVETGIENEIRNRVERFSAQIRKIVIGRRRVAMRSRARLHDILPGSSGSAAPSGNSALTKPALGAGTASPFVSAGFVADSLEAARSACRSRRRRRLRTRWIKREPHVQGFANNHTAVLAGGLLKVIDNFGCLNGHVQRDANRIVPRTPLNTGGHTSQPR